METTDAIVVATASPIAARALDVPRIDALDASTATIGTVRASIAMPSEALDASTASLGTPGDPHRGTERVDRHAERGDLRYL